MGAYNAKPSRKIKPAEDESRERASSYLLRESRLVRVESAKSPVKARMEVPQRQPLQLIQRQVAPAGLIATSLHGSTQILPEAAITKLLYANHISIPKNKKASRDLPNPSGSGSRRTISLHGGRNVAFALVLDRDGAIEAAVAGMPAGGHVENIKMLNPPHLTGAYAFLAYHDEESGKQIIVGSPLIGFDSAHGSIDLLKRRKLIAALQKQGVLPRGSKQKVVCGGELYCADMDIANPNIEAILAWNLKSSFTKQEFISQNLSAICQLDNQANGAFMDIERSVTLNKHLGDMTTGAGALKVTTNEFRTFIDGIREIGEYIPKDLNFERVAMTKVTLR